MKLKTLKDCKDLNEARELAIKWVKYFREINEDSKAEGLIKFHNITEEDLK